METDTESFVSNYISSAEITPMSEQVRRQRISIMCERMITDSDFYKAMAAFAESARSDLFGPA